MEFKTEQDVALHYETTKQEVVIFEGVVYDVEKFKIEHPGGVKIIERELGTNVEEKFEEEGHSKSALK
jgi:cytochrome b involved in lipid metabolism